MNEHGQKNPCISMIIPVLSMVIFHRKLLNYQEGSPTENGTTPDQTNARFNLQTWVLTTKHGNLL